jgi:hypothetical protein
MLHVPMMHVEGAKLLYVPGLGRHHVGGEVMDELRVGVNHFI